MRNVSCITCNTLNTHRAGRVAADPGFAGELIVARATADPPDWVADPPLVDRRFVVANPDE
ncbi:MAG TPA: hypothetical protein VIT65_04545, partial [Microlunatus sp.]